MNPSRDVFTFLLVISGGMVVGFSVVVWRAEQMLRTWATKSDLVILKKEYKLFCLSQGSFVFHSHSTRPVYLVTVRDKTGAVRKVWVACGSWLWGGNVARRAGGLARRHRRRRTSGERPGQPVVKGVRISCQVQTSC
jgi:hypothetical protein